MKQFLKFFCIVLIGVHALICSGDEIAKQAKPIVTTYENAVITIRFTLRSTFSIAGLGSEQEENVFERTGTIIDSSGLTVVSLTATDPSSIMVDLMRNMGEGGESIDYRVEVADIKMLFPDGSEANAKIVLRDVDLDLAFLRPESPVSINTFVDLSKTTSLDRLDPIISLYRMGKVAGRACGTMLYRVQAIGKKPREIYFLSDETSIGGYGQFHPALGGPAFSLDGGVAGIVVLKTLKPESIDAELEQAIIIMPAKDVAEVATQAPPIAATPEEKSTPQQTPQETPPEPNGEKKSIEITLEPR